MIEQMIEENDGDEDYDESEPPNPKIRVAE